MAKSSYKKMDINSLIKQAQLGDIKANEELVKRVQKRVYAMFFHLTDRKEDVSDLTQEALLRMAKSIASLKDVKRFSGWLNQIVSNLYSDFIRKNPEKYVEYDEQKLNEIKDKSGCEPGEKCLFLEAEKLIRVALLTLPQDLRLAIVLREYEGLSYEQIAKITNTAIGTVKSRLSRARNKLQTELKGFI